MLGQLRHDLLEQVELGAQGVQENQGRAFAGLDIAQPIAINFDALNWDIGRPTQFGRRFGGRSERFDREGNEPHAESRYDKDDQSP